MVDEKFEIGECGCLSYVGAMSHNQAVTYFNDLMKAGIWLDPDCSLEKREDWAFDEKCRMKGQMKKAFDTQDDIYGEFAFGIICHDRITGQFNEDVNFEGRE